MQIQMGNQTMLSGKLFFFSFFLQKHPGEIRNTKTNSCSPLRHHDLLIFPHWNFMSKDTIN